MNAASEEKLKYVMPELADRVRELAARCLADRSVSATGFEIRVTQGLRSWNEQDALYAKGRTAPGPKVTNCEGGHSWHNFGMAVDLVPDDTTRDGFQCDWNSAHPVWRVMEDLARGLGLECGAFWRTFVDAPHVQLTGRFPVGAPDDEVRQLFKDGGMRAVWDEAFVQGMAKGA